MFFEPKRSVFTISLLLLSMMSWPVLAEEENSADDFALKGLEWRMIGPYRGGRVTTVAGVADKPMLYYMGATGGGVWKTENAGTTWENISDEFFKVGTIGEIGRASCRERV